MKTYIFLNSIRKKAVLLLLSGLLLVVGCSDDTTLGLPPQDKIAPPAPTVTRIENMNGAAVIYFQAPKDDDMLCVAASYEINGKEYTAKSSVYKDNLKVEGFGKEGEYKVFLRSVDKSNNESDPVEVTVSPLRAPFDIIYETLDVMDSFGGFKVTWENADENNIIVGVLTKDSIGDWVNFDNIYTSAKEGMATIRGLDTIPATFGFVVRDRWDNYSPMMETVVNPLFEEQLNKSKFREVVALPDDAPPLSGSFPVRNIWNGNTVSSCYHSGTSGDSKGIGYYITFDMGQLAKLSRYKMWQRTESHAWLYGHNNLKHYVIYGCEEITAEMRETGSLEGWTFLYDAHCHKPSGEGPVTNEDKEYILNGDEHEIPVEAPPVRYIRIHMLENWSGGAIAQIGEMTFWGKVLESYY